MSELWMENCVPNKTVPSLRQRRGVSDLSPVNILNDLNEDQQSYLNLRNRSVELDTPDCNLSSISVSDSDSLFMEDVDEGANLVKLAVTTLTKHNLLLVEKLQSAKYYDFEMSESPIEMKKNNVTAKLDSLNILPEKDRTDKTGDMFVCDCDKLLRYVEKRFLMKCAKENLPMVTYSDALMILPVAGDLILCSLHCNILLYDLIFRRYTYCETKTLQHSTEIYLLRNENSRLRGALEEFRGQTLALHKQIDTLRALLDKNEQINCAQERRFQKLEQQIFSLGISHTRGQEGADSGSVPVGKDISDPKSSKYNLSDQRSPPRLNLTEHTSSKLNLPEHLYSKLNIPQHSPPKLNIPEHSSCRLNLPESSRLNIVGYSNSRLDFTDGPSRHPLAEHPSGRTRSLSEGRSPRGSPGYRTKRMSHGQRYDTRYKPRRCMRDVSITFTETPQLGPHKVILVGDSGVGKSSFMLRLCDDAFNEKMNPSFGLDFKTKVISVNGQEENIQIWDTAGQERFRSITQSYFRKVDGIILVYDITHEESFLNLQNWVTCIQESGQLSAPMTIIGNKLDLEHLRCVSREMATELANFYEADFVEVSAKDGRNINQLGYDLVSKLVERRAVHSRQTADSSFPVTRPPTKEYSEASCCVIL